MTWRDIDVMRLWYQIDAIWFEACWNVTKMTWCDDVEALVPLRWRRWTQCWADDETYHSRVRWDGDYGWSIEGSSLMSTRRFVVLTRFHIVMLWCVDVDIRHRDTWQISGKISERADRKKVEATRFEAEDQKSPWVEVAVVGDVDERQDQGISVKGF